jgi:spermidine/putrescine transport system ATP-binding protein
VNEGAIEQIGTADEIYHRPRTRFVAEFVGEANLFTARVIARSDAEVTLQVSDGVMFSADSAAVPQCAADVLISVRPEKIHIGHPLPADGAGFDAKIVEVTFRGQTARLRARTAGGLDFTVVVASGSGAQSSWQEGATVRCSVHPRDIVVFEHSQPRG